MITDKEHIMVMAYKYNTLYFTKYYYDILPHLSSLNSSFFSPEFFASCSAYKYLTYGLLMDQKITDGF